MTKAIICICSPRPDSLANALTYLVDSRDSLTFKLFLVSDNYASAPGITFIDLVIDFLDKLSAGDYQGRLVSVSPAMAALYQRAASALRDARGDAERVYASDFRTLLQDAAKGIPAAQIIIDVTSLPKPLAADITVTCAFRGFRVHSFELTRPVDRRKPEEYMYHAISANSFRYPCLTDPAIVESGMRELIPKKAVKISLLAICLVSVACFALLIMFGPHSTASNELILWTGLVASTLGIGTGALQLASIKGS
jgi:hypothetical protein